MIKLKDDKIKREKFIKDLFRLFDNMGNNNSHGLTIAINGKYGSGKTTLLGFIEEHNSIEKNFNIIKYDAWENNFFENPMIPILHSISKLEKGSKIKETAKRVIKNLPRALLSTFENVHGVNLQTLVSNENIFDEYERYKREIDKFKQVLAEYCDKKKSIFLIDELDRCLPQYQIKVLESLYHLLDIPNLIIVIALDRDQLENSIEAEFGKGSNSHGYLAKFIQYEIDLPEGDTYSYIATLMNIKILSPFEHEVKTKIAEVFRAVHLPIRECILIIQKLNLYYNKDRVDYNFVPTIIAVLLLIKRLDNNLYKKYFTSKREKLNDIMENIDLKKTRFAHFFQEIKNTQIEGVFKQWFSDEHKGHELIQRFIDLFYPIDKITTESLSNFFNEESMQKPMDCKNCERYWYPYKVNDLIDEIEMFI